MRHLRTNTAKYKNATVIKANYTALHILAASTQRHAPQKEPDIFISRSITTIQLLTTKHVSESELDVQRRSQHICLAY